MAGDWIKMRTDLPTDPAVIRMACALGCDAFSVVGRLHSLWVWADKHTTDGNAPGVTVAWVDALSQCAGFGAAMLAVGWLAQSESGIVFPHFDRHNGQTAKTRGLTAKRVASHKRKGNAQGNGGSVTVRAETALPREEKRREEEEKNPQPPAGVVLAQPSAALVPVQAEPPKAKADPVAALAVPSALDTPEFREAWGEWIASRKSRRQALSERAARSQLEALAGIGAAGAVACIRESIRNDWRGLFPEKFTPGSRPAGRGGLFDNAGRVESRILAQALEASQAP